MEARCRWAARTSADPPRRSSSLSDSWRRKSISSSRKRRERRGLSLFPLKALFLFLIRGIRVIRGHRLFCAEDLVVASPRWQSVVSCFLFLHKKIDHGFHGFHG